MSRFSLSPCLLLSLSLLLFVTAMRRTPAADFPPPDKLPANPSLPDPLTMLDGAKVTTKEAWESKRKPELKALFQHYMYGKLPPAPKVQKHEFLFIDNEAFGGKAKMGEAKLTFEGPDLKQAIYVLFVVPKNAAQKPPIFVGMNFAGNHTLLDDTRIHLSESWIANRYPGVVNERATEQSRGIQKDVWNVDLILDRGYGLATFFSGDVDADKPDSAGIAEGYFQPGQTTPADDDPGTIAQWAWGFHRAIDFVERAGRNDVDTSKIAVVGHSRNGKTALLAGAFDERIALVIPLQAGCGGTAPSRTMDTRAESVQRINASFPHWFCDNFKKFHIPVATISSLDSKGKTRHEVANQFHEGLNRLPFDQHCLIALCAPRPVLVPNAEEDLWANPSGQFELLRAATPVYQLYGSEGLPAGATPEMNKLIPSPLGYFIRPGKHAMTRPDWEIFLTYADKYLKK